MQFQHNTPRYIPTAKKDKLIKLVKKKTNSIKSFTVQLVNELHSHLITFVVLVCIYTAYSKAIEHRQTLGKILFSFGEYLQRNKLFFDLLVAIIVVLTLKFIKRAMNHWKRGYLAKSAGLFYCALNHEDDECIKSEEFLKKESLKNNEIRILGATGWETFGSEESCLHEAVKKCEHIQVILIHPKSSAIPIRAKDVNVDMLYYKDEINKTLYFLSDIKSSQPDKFIEVRFYTNYPLWKIILLQDKVWFWQYPTYSHVQESPCFAFVKSNDQIRSVYTQYYRLFNRRWNYCRYSYSFSSKKIVEIIRDSHPARQGIFSDDEQLGTSFS